MGANDSSPIDIDPFETPPRPVISLSNSWHGSKSRSLPNTPGRPSSNPSSRRASLDDNFTRFKNSILIPAAKWAYLPIQKSKNNIFEPQEYTIEYSVFRYRGKEITSSSDLEQHLQFFYPDGIDIFTSDEQFKTLISQVIKIIETDHIFPERIATGSSGSYFVFNIDTSLYKAGIFKPKDEEPYGPLSPKWTKWLHRTFFPCCFGRSCLIPNLGYISEAAAYVLDKQLQSYIVPHTEVVKLRSPSFFYKFWDKSKHVEKLPYKIGSFQVFLQGYINAEIWFKIYPVPNETYMLPQDSNVEVDANEYSYKFQWSKDLMYQFQQELEKLVILDYLMRNTDRNTDNFMIKIEWIELKRNNDKKLMCPSIKLGAIDSGLAFPWKHPDEWRSFPFGWLFLPLSIIGQPFSQKTRNHYLSLLTSKFWWAQTVVELRKVFMIDQDFKERMWLKQLAVLKGQAFNIVEILKLPYAGPLELTRRENLLVFDDTMYLPNGHSMDIPETELTPLLHPQLEMINEENVFESGYERMNRIANHEDCQQNKKVVIERLVKETSKPPVFTWC